MTRLSADDLRQLQEDADHAIARGDMPMEVSATLIWTLAREVRELRDTLAFALAALNDPEVLGEEAKRRIRAALSPAAPETRGAAK